MSTLHVENLKGLTSGGNANKIIVPSGQTLDASAATITPSANQTVKTSVSRSQSALGATTSTSYVDVLTSTITPSFNNSILLVSGVIAGISYEDGSNSYRGSTWRYLLTPSGGTAVEDFINYYQFHFPTGGGSGYWGGMVPFTFYYQVSSTVSHEVKIQAFARSGSSNYFRNRNGEISSLIIQEIKQ